MTLGFDFDIFKKDNDEIIGFSLGQIIKDKNDSKLPKQTQYRTNIQT